MRVWRLRGSGHRQRRRRRREEWRFHSLDLRRAREARRLERDFDAGLDAVALILDLSQEVRRLKAQLRALGATRSRRRART